MATEEINEIINLKSMYDFSISEVGELEIVKKDIMKIVGLLGGGCGILTLSAKRDFKSYRVKALIYDDKFQENTKLEDAIFDKSLYGESIFQVTKDFSKFNQRFGKFIKVPDKLNRLLYLPVIIQHAKSINNIGEIILLYNHAFVTKNNGEHIAKIIDRLLLRLRLSFTQDRMNRKIKQLATIIEIGKEIETVKEKSTLLKTVIDKGFKECKALFNHNVHAIMRIIDNNDLKAEYLSESIEFVPTIIKRIPFQFQKVIREKNSQIIEDFQDSSCVLELLETHKNNQEYCAFLKKIKSLIIIPIVTENNVIGTFTFCSEDKAFRTAEKRFFDDIVVITAIALDKLDAYQSKIKRLRLLNAMMKAIVSQKDNDRLLDIILKSGLRLVNSTSGSIRIVNKENNLLEHVCYKDPFLDETMSLGTGICGNVAETGNPIKEDDVLENEEWRKNVINKIGKEQFDELVEKKMIMRSEISAPLKVGKETIGTIDALKSIPNGFTNDDLDVFKDIAALSGIVLKRQVLNNRLDVIKDIVAYYPKLRAEDLGRILDEIFKQSLKVTKGLKGSIALLTSKNEKKYIEYLSVENISGLFKNKPIGITEKTFKDIFEFFELLEKTPKNISHDKLDNKLRNTFENVPKKISHKDMDRLIKSEIVVPIIFNTELKGFLTLASIKENRFNIDDWMQLKDIANQTGILIRTLELIKEREDNYSIIENELTQNLMQLSGMMAHQINTPLAGIQTHFSIIKDKLKMKCYDDLSTNLESVNKSICKISSIINRIGEFTKKASLELNTLNLYGVLDEALNFILEIKVRKDINIIKNYDKSGINELCFDRFKMIQVFINIIDNAFNAMNEHGDRLIITTLINNDEVHIIFEDNGIGIPEENKDKVFQTFFTTDQIYGTGLGLPISKRFIELHGGNLEMKSTEGKNTKFIIKLPYRKERESK